jgi:oligosaccharide repeat unit polymerase
LEEGERLSERDLALNRLINRSQDKAMIKPEIRYSSRRVFSRIEIGPIIFIALICVLSILALNGIYSGMTVWASVSIFILLISASLIYIAVYGAFVLSPAVFFLIYYILFLYVGTLIRFVEDPQEYQKTLRIVTLGIFFFSIGVLYTSIVRRFRSAVEFNKIRKRSLIDPWASNMPAVLGLFAGGLLLALLYFIHAGGIPAFAAEVETARVDATAGGGYFLLGISVVMPFASLVLLGKALARKKLKGIFIAIAAVLATSAIMLLAALKDLVPFFLLWIVFMFQFNYGRLSKKMMLVPLVSVSIAVVMAGFTMKHKVEQGYFDVSLLQFALEMISDRIFFAVVDVIHFIFKFFPERYDYWFGYSYWMNLTGVLPGADVGFGGWINTEAFGMGGGATVPVVAEFYVNFGEAGTYSGMFLTGIIVQSIYIYLLRKLAFVKRLDYLIALTFLGMGLVTMAVNSVFGYLLYTLAPIWACFIGLKMLTQLMPLGSQGSSVIRKHTMINKEN